MNADARWSAGILAVICFAAPIPLFAQLGADNSQTACQAGNLASSATVGRVVFRTYRSDYSQFACLKVFSSGKVVFRRTMDNGGAFTLGQQGDAQDGIPAVENGADVTGRGRPDMIVLAYTGGAHCCRIHYLFELEPKLRLLATIQDSDDAGGNSYFSRDPKDTHYYFHTGDWTFDYWPAPSYGSPNAPIVLRFAEGAKGGRFHLALDKMKTPDPTQSEWNEKLSDAQDALDPADMSSSANFWDTVLNLIYTGHSDLAWKFVDAMGPKAQQRPLPTLADFCGMLKQSPYWPDLKPTLKDTPAACANAGPKRSQSR